MWLPPSARDHASIVTKRGPTSQCKSHNIWLCQPGIDFTVACAIIIGCSFLYWVYLQFRPRKEPFEWRKALPFLFPSKKRKRRAKKPPVQIKYLGTELPEMESSPLGASLRASVLWPKSGQNYPALPEKVKPAPDRARAPDIQVYSPTPSGSTW
ncbi:hypothetical protein N0V93_000231 [Gnomoniopsis smithogilvyi]|uniref:Uncharacterized protein n=1 Tax=Gnomoniopsis smithogilvyi TaxID=1191159 RepID=A0A9W8Z1I6_9PEZI|nr:hypothetical protein N0V93_000231 [Gnomoniopsis smithogilvyi]